MQQDLSGFIDRLITDPHLAAPLRSLAGTVQRGFGASVGDSCGSWSPHRRFISVGELCQLESVLEQVLGVPEVMVCQNPAGSPMAGSLADGIRLAGSLADGFAAVENGGNDPETGLDPADIPDDRPVAAARADAGRSAAVSAMSGDQPGVRQTAPLYVAGQPGGNLRVAEPGNAAYTSPISGTVAATQRDTAFPATERDAEYLAGLSEWILRHLWHEDAFHAAMLRQGRFIARNGSVIIELPEECCADENESLLTRLDRLGSCALRKTIPFRIEPVRFDLLTQARADAAQQTRETEQLRQQAAPAGQSGRPTAGNGGGANGGANGHKGQAPSAGSSPNGAKVVPISNSQANGNGNGYASAKGANASANGYASAKGANGNGNGNSANGNGNGNGRTYRRPPSQPGQIWGRMNPALSRSMIADINSQSGTVALTGDVLNPECRLISDGFRLLVKFDLTDYTHTVQCVIFAKPEDQETFDTKLKDATVTVNAEIRVDARFSGELQAAVIGITEAQKPRGRVDEAPVKRVELHCHTKMSARDAVCDAEEIVRLAARFGHDAVAITDHGVVQSFPDARKAAQESAKKGKPIKVIYGMEGYLVDDGPTVAYNCSDVGFENGFIALDVETTGLDAATDRLIEIAAVRFMPVNPAMPADDVGTPGIDADAISAGGPDVIAFAPVGMGDSLADIQPDERLCGRFRVAAEWRTFVDPGMPISARTTELTGITDDMVAGAPTHESALLELQAFLGGLPVVAHNAFFDLGFLRYEGFRTPAETDPRLKFNPPLIDTLSLARHFLPDLRNHKLQTVAAALAIDLGRHHRALDDALTCGRILATLIDRAMIPSEEGEPVMPTLDGLNDLVGHLTSAQVVENRRTVYHVILLVQNPLGLYHLYRLVSESHTRYFHRRPRIPKSLLTYFRAGLLLGSACEQGEVFQGVVDLYKQAGNNYEQAPRSNSAPDRPADANKHHSECTQPAPSARDCASGRSQRRGAREPLFSGAGRAAQPDDLDAAG